MSLLIKVSRNGSSQEYLFSKPGPIIIGSERSSDLWLPDGGFSGKVLEVKLSGGILYVKELGERGQILLGSAILPFNEESVYPEGETLSFTHSPYRIQIHRTQTETEPPPFHPEEFIARLDHMNAQIRERELELQKLLQRYEKKKNDYQHAEALMNELKVQDTKLRIEVEGLKARKKELHQEVKAQSQKSDEAEDRMSALETNRMKLESEQRDLQDAIVAQQVILSNLKDERNNRNLEVEARKIELGALCAELSAHRTMLDQLLQERETQEKEILHEKEKVQHILEQADEARRESIRTEKQLREVTKEKSLLGEQVKSLESEVLRLEQQKTDSRENLLELRSATVKVEGEARKVQDHLRVLSEEESQLRLINGELSAQLVKSEEKLSTKKIQLNHLDFQTQDARKKLSQLNFEIEKTTSQLSLLTGEEKAQELKLLSLREEMKNLQRKAAEEKRTIEKFLDDERRKLQNELTVIRGEIEGEIEQLSHLEETRARLEATVLELHHRQQVLQGEKKTLEESVSDLRMQKSVTETEIRELRIEAGRVQSEKERLASEVAGTQIRLMDLEGQITSRLKAAEEEVDALRNQERAKLASEREVSLREVEAIRLRSLSEVQAEAQRKQDEINRDAESVLREARTAEALITREAHDRLKAATDAADQRESEAHERVREAETYFKRVEAEAQALLQKAKLESRDIQKKAESEFQDDLKLRKARVKKFLTLKQENGLEQIEKRSEAHAASLRRSEAKALQKIEDLKRRELKKISRLREEEITRQLEQRILLERELRAERESIVGSIREESARLEAELSQKKKNILDNIKDTKMRQEKSWEEEQRREREAFNRTKRERIENATRAVMNVLVSQGVAFEESKVRGELQSHLEMAINGQNAEALKGVSSVLDLNPMKRKRVFPVLKKYALKVGAPTAAAILLGFDVGSLRSTLVSSSRDLLKQSESASQMYVDQQKSEWKEKHTFNPATTVGYKPSFTENILYTTDFEKVMDNEEFTNEWILKVHDFLVKDLEVSEDVAINYISAEGTLVKELASAKKDLHPQFLDQGIKKLKDLEETHLGWLTQKIPEADKRQKFADFRKSTFDTFYREKFASRRGMASQNKE